MTSQCEQIEYKLTRHLERALKGKSIPKLSAFANDLARDVILNVFPVNGLEPKEAWMVGHLFFHGDVDDETVLDMQTELIETHENLEQSIPITLHLSSFGGDCHVGLALVSTIQHLRRAGRTVNCHIQGYAMSMGSIIAQACDHRAMDEASYMMLHKINYGMPKGTAFDDHEDELNAGRQLMDTLFALYSKRTGKPVEYYHKWLYKTDRYLTAQQAHDERLIDAILPTPAFKTFRKRTRAAA